MNHAKLAPSAAGRWMNCPGSVALTADIPDTAGPAAARGTACHNALASLLYGAVESETLATFSDDEREWIKAAVRWVRNMTGGLNARLYIEKMVPVGAAFGCPDDLWGTADVIIETAESLTVCDAKFGFESVEAEGNAQLSLYAIGWADVHGWKWDKYRLVIIQPRDPEGGRIELLDREALKSRADDYDMRIQSALLSDAPLVPGEEQCRWCRAAGSCPARAEHALALARKEFSPALLTPFELADVLDRADNVLDFIKAARSHAMKLLETGQDVPGWKRVLSNRHRAWANEKKAVKTLKLLGAKRAELYPPKLISPAQAEKLLKLPAGAIDELAPKPAGEPVLARESDPRPACMPDFPALDGHTDGVKNGKG